MVLFAAPMPREHAPLHTLLTAGARQAIAAVLTTSWPRGTTCHLAVDGTITAATGTDIHDLIGTRIFTTTRGDLTDLLAGLNDETNAQQGHTLTAEPDAEPPAVASTSGAVDHAEHDGHDGHADFDNTTVAASAPTGRRRDQLGTNSGGPHTAAQFAEKPPNQPITSETQGPSPGQPTEDTLVSNPASCTAGSPGALPRGDGNPLAGPPEQALVVVRCFESFKVQTRAEPGGRLEDITSQLSPKHRLLLACLASRPDGTPTADLLEAGWPDTPYNLAQQRQAATLSALRRIMRDAIRVPQAQLASHADGRYFLSLPSPGAQQPGGHPDAAAAEATVWVDYWDFLDTAAIARAHTATTRLDAQHRMAALYTATLLPNLDTHWIEAARTNAQQQAIAALAALAEHHQHSDPERATALLRVALEFDPIHQPTATQLIRLHQRRNQPDAAHHVYAQLAARLAEAGLPGPHHAATDALNTPPSSSTPDLAQISRALAT